MALSDLMELSKNKSLTRKVGLSEERIKEVLIELVKCNERSGYTLLNNISTSSMVDWLEKQESVEEIVEKMKKEGIKPNIGNSNSCSI